MKVVPLFFVVCFVLSGVLPCSADRIAALENGCSFKLAELPEEIVVQRPKGQPVAFSLQENATTGYQWAVDANASECTVSLSHRGAQPDDRRCGVAGRADVSVTSLVQTPVRVIFRYVRPWERQVEPIHTVRLIVYTADVGTALYPSNAVNVRIAAECAKRGLSVVDWHMHMRGGLTPELAKEREAAFVVRSSAMENHGREWEIYDNARLRDFAARVRAVSPKMPVGIQVNDRDWFLQIDAATRAQFDYVLADTMIMGKLPSGRDNRLWLVKEIPDPDAWMEEYFRHTMTILDEPISILANPTYLPTPVAADYDRLWTEDRMRQVIVKAVERGIGLEIQAGSAFPSLRFLALAKQMGAKFAFGSNNFDARPKDLSRWLEAIVALDLTPQDLWTPVRR